MDKNVLHSTSFLFFFLPIFNQPCLQTHIPADQREMASSLNLCNASYTGLPHSPGRVRINQYAAQFYSMPTSPFPEEDSDDNDFEFETSMRAGHRHQGQQKQRLQHIWQDHAPMAFADELFCNGQVMPLKPPPRLHYVNQHSNAASPTSPGSSILKGPFRRWSFNKTNTNDFDPFMVALEKVTNEARGRDQDSNHRRSRSLSPLRSPVLWYNSNDSTGRVQHQNGEVDSQEIDQKVGLTPGEQTEPTETTSPRPVSHKRSSRNRRVKYTLTTLPGPTIKTDESLAKDDKEINKGSDKGSKRFSAEEIAKESASATEGKANCEGKLRLKPRVQRKPFDLKNLSFRSLYRAHYSGRKDLANRELRNRTVIPYKAQCMLVCLGFGHNGLRDLN